MLEISAQRFPKKLSVSLPLSKSILARQLVLDYIYDNPLAHRLDELKGSFLSDDVRYLAEALKVLEARRNKKSEGAASLYVGQSGTAYRFLSVLSLFEKESVTLNSDPQLTRRITEEDQAPFERIGGHIKFIPEENRTIIYPANRLEGTIGRETWGTSQYYSALLLTKRLHPEGLIFEIDCNSSSYSYIKLTEEVIREYNSGVVESEGDWSAAAYWYQLMALHPEIEEICFGNLNPHSSQPDRELTKIYRQFGIETNNENKLLRSGKLTNTLNINLSQSLDLFPSLVLTAVSLAIPFEISGISNLRIKESNRIAAVLDNLKALGVDNIVEHEDKLEWEPCSDVPRVTIDEVIPINSFGDHRIAMAFGVLGTSLEGKKLRISESECVAKSYPSFFEELLSYKN